MDKIDLQNMSENQLCHIAEVVFDDNIANEAMLILRTKFDSTYFWCNDCDGLVCKKKDCCMNKKYCEITDCKSNGGTKNCIGNGCKWINT